MWRAEKAGLIFKEGKQDADLQSTISSDQGLFDQNVQMRKLLKSSQTQY